MVATFVWPWKNDGELLEVRDLFYPDAQLDETAKQEKQQLAVNIVNTWKLRRCRIPHSILATADLVDAILHHDLSKNSPSTIKAVYASALAKMVTSVCDLEQDSVEKRSMMEQAAKIGMPEEWVLLRHAITHGQTPGLRALEDAVKEALPWMWNHFWKGLEGENEVGVEELREELSAILEEYRRERRAMIVAKQEAALDTSLAAQTSKSIRRACKRRRDGLGQLIHVLLNRSIILPSEKQSNLKFKALLLVWDDLLLKIAGRLPSFYGKISRALTEVLISLPTSRTVPQPTLEMVSKWLRHFMIDSRWSAMVPPGVLEDVRCDVAETCIMNKNNHMDAILKELLVVISAEQASTFRQLLAYSGRDDSQELAEVAKAITPDEGDRTLQRTGWSRPVAVWVPRPLGM